MHREPTLLFFFRITSFLLLLMHQPSHQKTKLEAYAPTLSSENKTGTSAVSAIQNAEYVVSSMLAKGFILGKDTVSKAKTIDEKHQLTSTASAKVASLDKRLGLTEKITIINNKVREVDEKLQVSEKTKWAFAAAEQMVSNAWSAIL